MRIWVMCLLLANIIVSEEPARAGVIYYSYTGNPFTTFTGGYTCPPECSISGFFEMPQALAPNIERFTFSPVAFSFTDGKTTLTNANTNPSFTNFCVSTDTGGFITEWGISFPDSPVPNNVLFVTERGCGTSPVVDESAGVPLCENCFVRQAYNLDDPGTWSSALTVIPEPNEKILLELGFIGFIGTAFMKEVCAVEHGRRCASTKARSS